MNEIPGWVLEMSRNIPHALPDPALPSIPVSEPPPPLLKMMETPGGGRRKDS